MKRHSVAVQTRLNCGSTGAGLSSPEELRVFAACQPNSLDGSRGCRDWNTDFRATSTPSLGGLTDTLSLKPAPGGALEQALLNEKAARAWENLQEVVDGDVRRQADSSGPGGEQRGLQFGVGRQRHLQELGVHSPLWPAVTLTLNHHLDTGPTRSTPKPAELLPTSHQKNSNLLKSSQLLRFTSYCSNPTFRLFLFT